MDLPEYRVVLNYAKQETLITGIKNKFSARLNADAGKIMLLFAEKKLTAQDLYNKYSAFYERCKKFNWIKQDFHNYQISAINSLYHLKRVQIELSRFCNLNCSYCYSSSGFTQKDKLPIDKVKEFIDDAYNLGCLRIDFTGGEPLTYRGWEEVIAYAVNKGISSTLHTNGTLLSEKNVKKLKQIGILHVQISLDSHIPEVHDKARSQPGAFNKAILGIELCKKFSIPIIVSIVAHKDNQNHYVESVNYFSKILQVKVLMDRVIKAGREIYNRNAITTKTYFEMIKPLIKSSCVQAKLCDNHDHFGVEPFCGVAHSFIYITAEGEFALCPTMTSRDNPSLFDGPTSKHHKLIDVWNNSPYILKYRGLNCRKIAKCPANINCGGGCRSNAYIETDKLDAPDLLACNIFKNTTKDFAEFQSSYEIHDNTKEP